MKAVAGLYGTWRGVNLALEELRATGVDTGSVCVIAGDPDSAYAAAPETGAEVPVGTAGGLGIGGLVGGVVGWLVDAAELLAFEFEQLVLTGPLAAVTEAVEPEVAVGAGVGALAGGLLGTHAGWAFAEDEARAYRATVAHGSILLAVEVPNAEAVRRVVEVLRRTGAQHIRVGIARR
jgi:hypothetical protein